MIAAGHPPETVWRYTPRQIWGFLYFADKRRHVEWRDQVAAQAIGHRADRHQLDRALKE